MKRRDFLKIGLKAAALPALAFVPALAPEVRFGRLDSFRFIESDPGMGDITGIAVAEDPFERIGKLAWKSWWEGRVLNDGWSDNIMKQFGGNSEESPVQIDLKTNVFS